MHAARSIFAVLAASLLSLPARATTTWSTPTTRVSLCAETTGTGDAPTLATQGLALVGLATVSVFVEPATYGDGGYVGLTAGTLQAYLWNPSSRTTGAWYRAPDLDLTVATAQGNGFVGVNFQANNTRIAYVPVGLGQASNVYIRGHTK